MIAYRAGDSAAFDRLYSRHRGSLYRYLLRQCLIPAVAEELFQDVWISVIRARQRYVAEARFTTYLYRIAHNRVIDHFRRAVHRHSASAGEDGTDPVDALAADPSDQPEVRYQARARVERFGELLAGLPPEQREAFVMHEEGGLSVDEIAIATGVGTETAKSRLRYAITKLKRGLMEWL
jgi:RNA polymerase sigma-70 factor (ECF subfamily)